MPHSIQTKWLTEKVHGVFYGWWLVGVSALVMVIGTVPAFQGMPAWFVVLESNFGWSRAQLSMAFSLTRVEGSIMGPISGYLIDRVGPRRMVLIGLVVMGIGFVFFSRIQNLWQFYCAFMVMTSGMGLGTWLPMMTVLNSWFIKKRSIAMAIAMEGFALGGILLVPLIAWAIEPARFGYQGWRITALVIGITVLLLAYPISKLVRAKPENYGLLPDGTTNTASSLTDNLSSDDPTENNESDYTWPVSYTHLTLPTNREV